MKHEPSMGVCVEIRYRTAVEEVPKGEYTIPLGKAKIKREGSDITLVGWGQQVAVLEKAVSPLWDSHIHCAEKCVHTVLHVTVYHCPVLPRPVVTCFLCHSSPQNKLL